MKKISHIVVTIGMMLGVMALPLSLAPVANAAPADRAQSGLNSVGGRGQNNLTGSIETVINVILFLIGVAAVIMIIIGGLRYVLSGGDSSSTKSAKDTILYAVVGLVVAILAYAIVNFVIRAFV